MNSIDFVKRLKQRFLIEQQKQDRSGVYGYTQRSMAYNSNRIEGSTLTERQTTSIFETGTVSSEPDVLIRTKDIEELNGHFKMFNYMLKNMHRNLRKAFLKILRTGMRLVSTREEPIWYQTFRQLFPKKFPSG